MEDGDAAEVSTGPFCLVFRKLGVDGLEERPHEGDLEPGADN